MFERNEGSGIARLFYEIKQTGHNVDTEIRFATVMSVLPLRIKMDGSGLELDSDDFLVSRQLTDHTRKVIIDGTEKTVSFKSVLNPDDRVVLAVTDEVYFIIDKVEVT